MRLKPEESKKLATHVTDLLLKDRDVTVKIQRPQLLDTLYNVLHSHFEEERMIDVKTDELVKEKGESAGITDRGKALMMIKRQIAKEKSFILSGGIEGRFSQDKINFISHLCADKVFDDDLIDFKDEDEGVRYFKRVYTKYFALENELDEKVRKKIRGQANAPFEGSRDWDVLFRKYREEELKRLNHS